MACRHYLFRICQIWFAFLECRQKVNICHFWGLKKPTDRGRNFQPMALWPARDVRPEPPRPPILVGHPLQAAATETIHSPFFLVIRSALAYKEVRPEATINISRRCSRTEMGPCIGRCPASETSDCSPSIPASGAMRSNVLFHTIPSMSYRDRRTQLFHTSGARPR